MMHSDMRWEMGGRSEAGRQSKTRTHTSDSGGKKVLILHGRCDSDLAKP